MDFVRPLRSIALRLVSGRGHYETVIQAVREARCSVWIATANVKELMVEDDRWSVRRRLRGRSAYRSMVGIFADLANAGVTLRILHAALPSRPFRAELLRHPMLRAGSPTSGARSVRSSSRSKPTRDGPLFEMRACPRVHLKIVAVDGRFLYLGSANFTGAGLGAKGSGRRNFEMGVVTDDELLLDDVQELFDRVWRGAECAGCTLRSQCAAPLASVEAGGLQPPMPVRGRTGRAASESPSAPPATAKRQSKRAGKAKAKRKPS